MEEIKSCSQDSDEHVVVCVEIDDDLAIFLTFYSVHVMQKELSGWEYLCYIKL